MGDKAQETNSRFLNIACHKMNNNKNNHHHPKTTKRKAFCLYS